jgi:hypothetical protein
MKGSSLGTYGIYLKTFSKADQGGQDLDSQVQRFRRVRRIGVEETRQHGNATSTYVLEYHQGGGPLMEQGTSRILPACVCAYMRVWKGRDEGKKIARGSVLISRSRYSSPEACTHPPKFVLISRT